MQYNNPYATLAVLHVIFREIIGYHYNHGPKIMGIDSYLKENVDTNVTIKPWHGENTIPIFLRNSYNFHEMKVLGTSCILMEIVNEIPGIVTLQKHIKRI